MIYHLFFSDIGFAIEQAVRTWSGKIAAVLYDFIINLYNVFMIIARAQILNEKYIKSIYNRVGMILGLFMLFKLAFSLIQTLVDPNKFTDDKKGFVGIIKRIIISIVLLGITPSLFDFAFDIQAEIVGTENDSSNVIYRFIVADQKIQNTAQFGNTLATDLYFNFFTEKYPGSIGNDINSITDPDDGSVSIEIENYDTIKSRVKDGSMTFDDLVPYLTARSNGEWDVNWDILFSLATSIVVIYILINYCVAIATRVIQLAYLQLIAPVPILSYIGDPDGAFQKWLKQCTATYLDLFLRLAIIYFIITLSQMILSLVNDDSTLFESTGLTMDSPEYIWVKIFLLIGLLMFGKRVPELLKELFPGLQTAASSGLGIKSIKGLAGDVPIVGGLAAGAIGYGLDKAKGLGKSVVSLPGKGLKSGAKWAANKATAPFKRKFDNWKSNRGDLKEAKEALKEENKLYNEGQELFNKYGTNVADSFENEEFRQSYNELENAKSAVKNATTDVERKNAEDVCNKVKARHEIMQKRYQKDAGREKAFGEFKRRNSEEWKQEANRNEFCNQNNPDEFFKGMNEAYSNEKQKNGGSVSEDFDKQWHKTRDDMEKSYKRCGWNKDGDGNWKNTKESDKQ